MERVFEFKSSNNYYRSRIIEAVLICIGFLISLIVTPGHTLFTVTLMVFFVIFLFAGKFTNGLSISGSSIVITDYHFFIPGQVVFELNKVSMTIKKSVSLRGRAYSVMTIKAGKKVYEIDSRDGFDDALLLKIKNLVEEMQAR